MVEGYEVLRIIGKGNYGDVLLAKRPGYISDVSEKGPDSASSLCVIKSVKHTKKKDGANIEAIQEVRILSDLKHPCIVEYVDSFITPSEERLYIVMAYCESGNLQDRIKEAIENQKWLDEKLIVGWFSQIALALAFIHGKHILHRDVKPENVFLTQGGRCVKLGDFGFTRTMNNTLELALTKCGTPYYLSPEQCKCQPYNAKADVWAAGIVLYELLALQVPFKGKSLPELRNNILRAALKRPAAHYSKGICNMLLKMLSRDADRRPKMSEVVGNALCQNFLRNFITPSAPRRSGERPRAVRERASAVNASTNFLQKLVKDEMAAKETLESSRRRYWSLRQKRPRESPRKKKWQVFDAKPPTGKPVHSRKKVVATHSSPAAERRRISTSSRRLNVGVSHGNPNSYPSSMASPQMKRMRSDSPAKFGEGGGSLGDEDPDKILASICDVEMKLHHLRQSMSYEKELDDLKNVFRASLKSQSSGTSSRDYSDDFEEEDEEDALGNTLKSLQIDSDDDGISDADSGDALNTSLGHLGRSMLQMTVDGDDLLLGTGGSTLVHASATPDDILNTSLDRDIIRSLSNSGGSHRGPSSPRAMGSGVRALRTLRKHK
jgi:NIMA (never in mitosis gene a)-related kinase